MAEAHVASVSARADTILGVIRSPTAVHRHLARAEPWLRLAVPTMLGAFLVCLFAGCLMQGRSHRETILVQAAEDIEALARLATAALTSSTGFAGPGLASGRGTDLAGARERLRAVLPNGALPHQRRILLADPADRIVAALPALPLAAATLADHLGDAQPLTLLGGRAGVMTIDLASGEQALATVQDIPGGGRIAVVQTLEAAAGSWSASARGQATLVLATALVIVCMGVAYTMQAGRACAVDALCERIKRRVDTAFGRGRCGLWDWDIARGSVYWSDSMYELLGFARDPRREFLSFGEVNTFVHPDDGDLYALARHLAAGRQGAVDHEFRLRHASGDWVWLKARAEIVNDPEDGSSHLVGIFVDITEQRRLAEAGAASDARLRDAVEAVSEAFVLWDAQNRLVLCNSKFRDLHNLPASAAIPGRRYSEVMGGASPPRIRRELPQSGRPGGDGGARTLEAELADGRWLQISERRTKDGGYVSVGTDVTDLKRNQERLVESERALLATVRDLKQSRQTLEVQAQQLADIAERYLDQKAQVESALDAKSAFLARMSHELRTPLNAIIGFAEIMETERFGPLGTVKYGEYCHDIRTSGEYLLSVFDDILDMSRIEAEGVSLAPRPIRVAAAVERALRLVAEPIRVKHLSVVRSIDPDLVVHADERALQQMLVNLLQNAVKFTREEGVVACRVRAVGAMIHIFVEDTGIGIPRSAMARIGQPFEQVESEYSRSYKGSGLGLAIARSLAELHGGRLRLRSQEGLGTIALLRLPAADAADALVSAPEALAEA